jgi:phage-related protein
MKILKLGHKTYTVYAVYDENDGCPVLESLQLLGKSNRAAKRMLHKLLEYIPEAGANLQNTEKVKKLKGVADLFEFREQPSHGPKVRVLAFMDGNRIIVCTNAFEKRSETPRAEIDIAQSHKERYFNAKKRGSLEIVELENDDE